MTELQESILFPAPENSIEFMELTKKKETAQRAKCLCLEKMGKHPLMNVSIMNQRDKRKLLEMVRTMMEEETEEHIIKDFNDLCCERLFGGEEDYSKFKISGGTQPAEPPPIDELKIDPIAIALEYDVKYPMKPVVMDCGGNAIEIDQRGHNGPYGIGLPSSI